MGFTRWSANGKEKKTSCNRITEVDYVVKEGGSRLLMLRPLRAAAFERLVLLQHMAGDRRANVGETQADS